VAEFMQESIVFLLRVQCRRKESSRSLSHLLMSFLYLDVAVMQNADTNRNNRAISIFSSCAVLFAKLNCLTVGLRL